MKRTRSSYKEQKPKIPLVKKTFQNDAALMEVPETSRSRPPLCKSVSDERRAENIASLQTETEAQITDSITRGRQTDLELKKTSHGRMENYSNTLGQMITSIIKEISKEAGGLANLSRSLVDNSISNGQMGQSQVNMALAENESQLNQNPEYKQPELDVALAVIKKTMELAAADPFNRPVDPVALALPDYFDIIDTPMDFGTICNNLENGLKYMNSADVFKDVQYIWNNCFKYNKKGDYILELMKRVKTYFMKHWKAAGLHTKQSPAVEFSISRHSKRLKENTIANNLTQLQQSKSSQPQQNFSQQQSSPEKDEPSSDSTNTQKKPQIQEPNNFHKLLMTVGRMKIVTNELGQPVGREAAQLTSFVGHTARDGNLAPLTYPSWIKMPEENKENMWQKILTRFDIDPSCRSWVLKALGTKWRNFKADLKAAHYDIHATDEERLADRDERVLPDQWSFLVSQWSSEKFQRISAQNKANRAKVRFIHTSGRKSFARLLEEERTKRPDGQEPSQAELFILTRTHKTGEPVNDATAASQLRESTTQDDVSVSGLNAEALRMMVKEKNAEVVEMKERLASVEQTCSQMAAQMSAMMSMMANMHSSGENIPNHSEPASTSNHEVSAKKIHGRKKRS